MYDPNDTDFTMKQHICHYNIRTILFTARMIYTLKIDDNTPIGKRLIQELRKYHKEVTFENPSLMADAPEGYINGDVFFTGIKEELKKRSQEKDLLQQNCSE